MTTAIVSTNLTTDLTPPLGEAKPAPRRIAFRTRGHAHGGITRLISPGDVGEFTKPFVFLDRFELDTAGLPAMPMHPHSGIATHTTLLDGSLFYADSTGAHGRLPPGSIEYMQAGGGVWHGGKPGDTKVRGFQLWLSLPPDLELAPAASSYVEPAAIPSATIDGGRVRVRVLLGSFGDLKSVIGYPAPLTYLHVSLAAGARWSYQPGQPDQPDHDVAWLALSTGSLRVDGKDIGKELVVFEEGNGRIDVEAKADAELVIASGVKHPHPLYLGMYSVHTSEEALLSGEAGYRKIAVEKKDMIRSPSFGR